MYDDRVDVGNSISNINKGAPFAQNNGVYSMHKVYIYTIYIYIYLYN